MMSQDGPNRVHSFQVGLNCRLFSKIFIFLFYFLTTQVFSPSYDINYSGACRE